MSFTNTPLDNMFPHDPTTVRPGTQTVLQPPSWAGAVVSATLLGNQVFVICQWGVFKHTSAGLEPIPFVNSALFPPAPVEKIDA